MNHDPLPGFFHCFLKRQTDIELSLLFFEIPLFLSVPNPRNLLEQIARQIFEQKLSSGEFKSPDPFERCHLTYGWQDSYLPRISQTDWLAASKIFEFQTN